MSFAELMAHPAPHWGQRAHIPATGIVDSLIDGRGLPSPPFYETGAPCRLGIQAQAKEANSHPCSYRENCCLEAEHRIGPGGIQRK
jgi:hypothetical protein